MTFSYTIADLGGLTDSADVALTITPVNDLPVAVDDAVSTDEDTAVTIPVLANDTDPDTGDVLIVTGFTQPPATQGAVTAGPDGTLIFTPAANFNGEVTFTYTIRDRPTGDPDGLTADGTVTVTVLPVNDAPLANPDVVFTPEDTGITIDVVGNDSDVDGDALTIAPGSLTTPANGTVTITTEGAVRYTPNLNFNGTDTFTYRVTDGKGGFSDPATVTVAVRPVNDPPVATDGTATTDEDAPVTGSVAPLVSDVDIDADGNGDTLTFSVGAQPANGSITIAANGAYTYMPNRDYNGADQFSYVVTDQAGASATAVVTVTIAAVDDLPVVRDGTRTTPEDTGFSGSLAGLATDVDSQQLTFSLVNGPANGTVRIEPDGRFSYVPNANFNGEDPFTFAVSDGAGRQTFGTFDVVVTPVNDAPVASPRTITIDEDQVLTDTLAGLATDIDGDPLTFSLATAPANGTIDIAADGSFTYTPEADFNGTDTFSYTVRDGQGGSATATVMIRVAAANDAPVAVDDGQTYARQPSYTIDVTDNDTDVDGDPLAVDPASLTPPISDGATVGTLEVNDDGDVVFTPTDPGFVGLVTFTYQATDGTATSNPATVTLDIGGGNEAPTANDDSFPDRRRAGSDPGGRAGSAGRARQRHRSQSVRYADHRSGEPVRADVRW